MLRKEDITQLEKKGITQNTVNTQIEFFKKGFPFLPIVRAALAGDGICRFDTDQINKLADEYNNAKEQIKIVKFVPASGAATRMFKEFFEFVNQDKSSKVIDQSLKQIVDYAFFDDLKPHVGIGMNHKQIISAIVGEGLNYGKLPKGLIKFHNYTDGSRTALEEHMAEGAMYAAAKDGMVNIHFTVSPEHQTGFEEVVSQVKQKYEKLFGVKYNISYSQQKPKTDTIAVDMNNEPFREADDTILFRPGGHGALLENLNDIDADIIFIKNIDNVVPDHLKPDTVLYKKVIAGLLLNIKSRCDEYMKILEGKVDDGVLTEIKAFTEKELQCGLGTEFDTLTKEEQAEVLKKVIDRPIRVCGMVKNEGEPGGGPFWVRGEGGCESLQIAESSQIAPEQSHLMSEATHFNPVDLVCCVKNYLGKKYDLTQYSDPNTGFISIKSKDGKELKAQELPGLWNGAMANWNTIFVEVPISTFNPVKSVADLLKKEHQPA